MKTHVINGRDGDRVDTVGVAIKVALISVVSAVATSENINRTLPSTTVIDSVHESLLNQIIWPFHRLAIIWRAPTATVDRNILEAVIEGGRFISV